MKKELTVQEVLANAKTASIQPIYTPGNLSSEKNMKEVLSQVMDGLQRDFGGIRDFKDAGFSLKDNHIAIKNPSQHMLNLVLSWLVVNRLSNSSYFTILPHLIIDGEHVMRINAITNEAEFDLHPKISLAMTMGHSHPHAKILSEAYGKILAPYFRR